MRNSISEYQLSDEADSSAGIKILDRLGFDPRGELVSCLPLPQGVDRTRLDNRMIDASTVLGEGFQSTPGNQALMRGPLSFKVWSTGTELTERVTTEMYPPAAECTFQDQSVLAEPSGPR